MSFINGTNVIDSSLVPYFPEELEVYQNAVKVAKFFFSNIYPAIFVMGCLSNLLIIIYFVKFNSRNLKKISLYHFLIINLAIADLCASAGVFNNPYNYLWELGEFTCIFLSPFITSACPMVSCWLLVLISFVRFRSIVYPLRERINKKRCGLCILIIWIIFYVLFFVLYFAISKSDFRANESINIINSSVTHTLDTFLPLAIMLLLYNKMKKRLNIEANGNSFALTDQSRQRNRRALRTIKGLILLFIVTVIPIRVYSVFKLVFANYVQKSRPLFFVMGKTVITLSGPLTMPLFYMNFIVNIFIYAKMIPDFRRFLLAVFTFGM